MCHYYNNVLLHLRASSFIDSSRQVDSVAHVGDALERVDEGPIGAAHCTAI